MRITLVGAGIAPPPANSRMTYLGVVLVDHDRLTDRLLARRVQPLIHAPYVNLVHGKAREYEIVRDMPVSSKDRVDRRVT